MLVTFGTERDISQILVSVPKVFILVSAKITGFSIEGGTRRLIAAYFEIYSRLLCVKVAFLCFFLTPLALLKSLLLYQDHLVFKNLLRTLKLTVVAFGVNVNWGRGGYFLIRG